MHVVFLGNCQVQVLATIIRHFVSPYVPVTTDFIDAFAGAGDLASRMRRADAVVAQLTLQPQPIGHDVIPPGVPVQFVPAVSGAFLYPHQGVPHPARPLERTGVTPFSPEYSDRYLGRLYMEKTAPADALARYRGMDVARTASVGRLYELTMESQRGLDARTGHACADIIERHLGDEQLFQSAYHFGGRIARHLAATLCDRLGFDAKFGQRIRDHLQDAPFVRLFVPVHPSVARWFGMRWVKDETRYPYRFEGSFTFDEYVIRFMEVRWSEAIQDGVVGFQQNDPACKAKLEAGLKEAPRSAEGPHALSHLAEREGDLRLAVALQKRASAVALDGHIHHRLGRLLLRTGDHAGAEQAFRSALRLDPVSPAGWSALRETLTKMDRLEDALDAARQEIVFATDPMQARKQVEWLRKRIAARAEATETATVEAGRPETGSAELLAHVAGLGDRSSDPDGWVGIRGSRRAIEGFAILHFPAYPSAQLTYQAVLKDGSLSGAVGIGGYCGTRGKNMPIYGLRLSAGLGDGAGNYVCEAQFVDGSQSGPVPPDTVCRAGSGAALEAFRVVTA